MPDQSKSRVLAASAAGVARKRVLLAVAVSLVIAALAALSPPAAADVVERPGWRVGATSYDFAQLSSRLKAAVKAEKMGLVTRASASDGAKGQGIEIPGNEVVGVYRNDYARRMLEVSVAAGIEAPIRFYVTANQNGGATLSYKLPSSVFAPYMDEGGANLEALATELDGVFAAIADRVLDAGWQPKQ